jgi:hypothetical protein
VEVQRAGSGGSVGPERAESLERGGSSAGSRKSFVRLRRSPCPTPDILHPTPRKKTTPHTPRSTPYTLHPTPDTLPLHPKPNTLNPQPSNLNTQL